MPAVAEQGVPPCTKKHIIASVTFAEQSGSTE